MGEKNKKRCDHRFKKYKKWATAIYPSTKEYGEWNEETEDYEVEEAIEICKICGGEINW